MAKSKAIYKYSLVKYKTAVRMYRLAIKHAFT